VKPANISIDGPMLVTPAKFVDERGFVSETYNAQRLSKIVVSKVFVQDNHSLTLLPGTIRGLHYQIPPMEQGKLVRVVRGRIFDVAVDIRVGSPTFSHYMAVELSAHNWSQFWVPAGFAHGFCTLEANTEVIYKLTDYFSPEHERGIIWNDPMVGIEWPVSSEEVFLSAKDGSLQPLEDQYPYFPFMG
jgi:dTDP-4-dehydrorhamnose 3,5-epimerase